MAVRRVRDRLDREHARPLDVEALARAEGLSAGHLSSQFRLAYGVSPASYLAARRNDVARGLVPGGGLGLGEVAVAVG